MTQLKTTCLSVAVTLGMHWCRGFRVPLLLACTQPFFLAADPLFRCRVLGIECPVERPSRDTMKKCDAVCMLD